MLSCNNWTTPYFVCKGGYKPAHYSELQQGVTIPHTIRLYYTIEHQVHLLKLYFLQAFATHVLMFVLLGGENWCMWILNGHCQNTHRTTWQITFLSQKFILVRNNYQNYTLMYAANIKHVLFASTTFQVCLHFWLLLCLQCLFYMGYEAHDGTIFQVLDNLVKCCIPNSNKANCQNFVECS
jgi:hypothetical protein